MGYQRITNLLENKLNQQSKFRANNWLEVNDVACGRYNINNQIKFKTSMLKSRFCDYCDAQILDKVTISLPNTTAARADTNNGGKDAIFQNCAPSTDCINEMNNTQIENAKDLDVAMLMYDLTEYSDNYSKTSRVL